MPSSALSYRIRLPYGELRCSNHLLLVQNEMTVEKYNSSLESREGEKSGRIRFSVSLLLCSRNLERILCDLDRTSPREVGLFGA